MPIIRNPDETNLGKPFIDIDPTTGQERGIDVRHEGHAAALLGPVYLLTLPVTIPWFYPLTAIATVFAAWVGGEMADARLKIHSGPLSWAAMALGGAIALFVGMRLEQFFGRWFFYRWPRWIARALIPTFLVSLIARLQLNLAEDITLAQHLGDILENGSLMTATIVALVLTLFALTMATYLRPDWHAFLNAFRLRKETGDDLDTSA